MVTLAWTLRSRCARSLVVIATFFMAASVADARNYLYQNITDLPGGPGSGRSAVVNDAGDIAFISGDDVWFYDRSANSFQNVTALAGAPVEPFFVKINNNGDLAIVETPTSTRDLWLFRASTQAFTNISSLAGYPGDSLANFSATTFDINDSRQISFHSGDNNFGSVYVYSHATSSFDWINGKPGAAFFGRENEINNLGQVAYMGFPSTYLYNPATNTTTNINSLPGGPGAALTNLDLNDLGDVALVSASLATLYDASSGTFLDIDATPGWPAAGFSFSRSDLGNGGDITFWKENLLYAFDSNALRFSQLANFPGGPQAGQTENAVNSSGQIVITAGTDVYFGTPRPYGDYDNDGAIDRDDLALWEATYASTVAIGTAADGNSDREINGRDFLAWQRTVTGGVPLQSTSPVPEPTTATMVTIAIALVLSRSRRAGTSTQWVAPTPVRT